MGPKAESDLEKNLDDPCARSLGRSDDIRRGFDWSVIHFNRVRSGRGYFDIEDKKEIRANSKYITGRAGYG